MINRYPLWKYLLILVIALVGVIYALPNLYGEDPAIQVSASRSEQVDAGIADLVRTTLREEGIEPKSVEVLDERLLVRFRRTEEQLEAADLVQVALGGDFVVALNLASAEPEWLTALNAKPMYLGLDLRGGVHFLLEVDMEAAVAQAEQRYVDDFRGFLRRLDDPIRYITIGRKDDTIVARFRTAGEQQAALSELEDEFGDLDFTAETSGEDHQVVARIPEAQLREIRNFALQQNITTLRNRVNELGVAEPVIQQQGDRRIVVQLPGVQDTARAKEILGATATLEFRLVDEKHDPYDAAETGRAPIGTELYRTRDGQPVLLERRVIVTGDRITNASSGFDQDTGGSAVFINLDGAGANQMQAATRDNIGRPMAVLFIENKVDTREVDGELVKEKRTIKEVINIATIRDQLSRRFQITGLDSTNEARDLALLLRAGALAAPIEIIEERTVGPSMGRENVEQGQLSVLIGFVCVLIFMAIYYKAFGLVANVALTLNLVLIVAVLSMLQATLTLPGIAGIVLTVGMAVDANVLIYERIREEIRNGNSPQSSIHSGYEKAFSTIADANITTLIAAIVLFSFGTGPVKGFAVTLSIGIVTSMFTAIMGTRALVNLVYGSRRLQKLSI
ncbi:preprotein translocase subunit SecD [Thiohalobacter thiocyanaticus]|uniref:Protein translocase subunit SecD n=1 Tax=Thiohalobacter thiocyanaticus TaxID=585455 RepID=A0A1Z4VR13_9GAMM|nr:protein translocase subunit SecD [Thiohalobacter thiocyanaticus]BAZ93923.1 preprotein translocase subunit SecD [Thiohalobacter thiocyanaticus]